MDDPRERALEEINDAIENFYAVDAAESRENPIDAPELEVYYDDGKFFARLNNVRQDWYSDVLDAWDHGGIDAS